MGWMLAVQLNGSDIAEHFPRLAALRSRWVLDHHGKFFRGARPDSPEIGLLKRLIDGGTCWYKVAGCYESSLTGAPDYADVAQVARHIAAVAPQRIVWGTNFPHNLAQTTAEYPDDAALLETTLGWLPSDTARHRALVENPVELYQF